MHAGKWEKKILQGAELRARRWHSGLGRIGLEVAGRARGFGLEIVGLRSVCLGCLARENGIRLVTQENCSPARITSRCTWADAANFGSNQCQDAGCNEEGVRISTVRAVS